MGSKLGPRPLEDIMLEAEANECLKADGFDDRVLGICY